MNPKKRQRSENWFHEDKIILKDLVKDRVRIIENKNTDTNSNTMKVAAWNDLKESFNCMCKGSPRSVMQLKAQWGLIKINEKKRKAEERREILKTGGGPPHVMEAISTEDISSWLPNEFLTDTNKFDSDSINQNDRLHLSTCTKINDLEDFGKENTTNVQEIILNVDTEKAQAPEHPKPSKLEGVEHLAPSSSQLLDPPMPSGSQVLGLKPRKIKKQIHRSNIKDVSAAEKVAACELECRRELHKLQIKNENLKYENLMLDQELLKCKIEYYRKK